MFVSDIEMGQLAREQKRALLILCIAKATVHFRALLIIGRNRFGNHGTRLLSWFHLAQLGGPVGIETPSCRLASTQPCMRCMHCI